MTSVISEHMPEGFPPRRFMRILAWLPAGLRARVLKNVTDDSLRGKAVRSSFWTLTGYGISQALSLISSLILTRLLMPEVFGVMSLVQIFMRGLAMFSDVGIGPAIIQSKHGEDEKYLNTAWTIQVCRGLVLFLCIWLFSSFFASAYDQPLVGTILSVTALSALIAGFNSTKLFTANRSLTLGRLTLIELLTQAAGLLVQAGLALIFRSIWALVVGGVFTVGLKTILSHTMLPGTSNRLHWDRPLAGDLFRFGRWIFFSTALTFLAMQGDRIVLGKLLSMESLGIYSVAYLIAQVPREILKTVSSKIIFPAAATMLGRPREEFRRTMERHRRPVLLGMAVLLAMLAGFGDQVVLVLWDTRYAPAAWMLPMLAIGVWPRVLTQTGSVVLMTIRKLQWNPIGSIGRILMVCLGVPAAHAAWGMPGAVAVVAVSDVPNYVASFIGLNLNRLGQFRQDALATLFFLGLLTLIGLARISVGLGLPLPP